MTVDLQKFYQATNPSKTLVADNPEDQKIYIDFSSVRGGEIINKLKNKITFFSPDSPTCMLFTGHIGCGKSTELLRLKSELEKSGFHVIYFESSDDLEMTDVDISDVLLAIARRVGKGLENVKIAEPKGFKALLNGLGDLLQTEIELAAEASLPGVGKVSASTEGKFDLEAGLPGIGQVNVNNEGVSLALGIGKITAKAKSDSTLRDRLNQFLAPQKTQLLEIINRELLEPAIAQLKQQGKKGLAVIVDNLDRLDNRPKPWGTPQQEYLFIDQGEFLTKLHCHVVYTIPLALKFSKNYGMLVQRLEEPKVLPMVPIQHLDGSEHLEGMALLRQMVLARAFPDLEAAQRLEAIPQIFDSPTSLDRLCQASGGHARDLLRLLNEWISEEMALPLSISTLEAVIRNRLHEMALPISDEQWELLRAVKQKKDVSGDEQYQTLIRSRLVFEYRDRGEYWFDLNPILAAAKQLQ